ncbi:MAG: shikimate kinase [Bacteroidetes bacterium]|nr:MAG: shikimate kinase [Bacteroidota bacterium]
MVSRIFLIGFMGSGKSTLGSKLAGAIGYGFVDMDLLIEETAGMTIPGIFREHGEHIFRKWEHDILMEICRKDNIVVSTGGGAPCHGDMMSIMNRHGVTIYIRLPPSVLRDRLLQSKTDRPLIRGKSSGELEQFIQDLLGEREKYYNQASLVIDGINQQVDALVRILETIPGSAG